MGVAENFKAFRDQYLIKAEQIGSISYRYKRITSQLNHDFWNTDSETAHSLYIGSYGRDTAARGVSDIDVYFRLPYSVYEQYNGHSGNGQSALLHRLKNSVLETYGTTSLKSDGQVVVVAFGDGIRFEILPGFENKDASITFPDSNAGGSWRVCNPQAELNAFTVRNSWSNGNLKAIGRMARIWRQQHNVPMSGMLIDTIAYQFIETWPWREKSYYYHDYLVRDFFEYVADIDPTKDTWRAPGSNSWVYKTGSFRLSAAEAYRSAVNAIAHQVKNEPWAERLDWQLIFGTDYNVY